MVKLLIIADDFTGALDTGVQFSKRGISTQVFTDFKFSNESIHPDTEILVIDTESRSMSKEQAYQSVNKVSRWAIEQNIKIIFKKTDSALRGNIGSELQAVTDAYPKKALFFIPGHPGIGRIIQNGTSYISGQPLEDSVFGKDPFDPVSYSYVPDIINEQSEIGVDVITIVEETKWEKIQSSKIYVFDTLKIKDIDKRLDELMDNDHLSLIAGCNALAGRLVKRLFPGRNKENTYSKTKGLYISCGSLNEITKKQVEFAEKCGFNRKRLKNTEDSLFVDSSELLEEIVNESKKNQKIIVDTFDFDIKTDTSLNKLSSEKNRYLITKLHGQIAKEMMDKTDNFTILMTGGDTLMGLMKRINCNQINPISEIEEGVVLSEIDYKGKKQQVISKSGGFGTEDVFCRIAEKILD